jgi:hypothetical protein
MGDYVEAQLAERTERMDQKHLVVMSDGPPGMTSPPR